VDEVVGLDAVVVEPRGDVSSLPHHPGLVRVKSWLAPVDSATAEMEEDQHMKSKVKSVGCIWTPDVVCCRKVFSCNAGLLEGNCKAYFA